MLKSSRKKAVLLVLRSVGLVGRGKTKFFVCAYPSNQVHILLVVFLFCFLQRGRCQFLCLDGGYPFSSISIIKLDIRRYERRRKWSYPKFSNSFQYVYIPSIIISPMLNEFV